MEAPFQIIIYLATSFAALSPLIFIAIRESIKRQRQEIITDLAFVFGKKNQTDPTLIPSFEFVKYKYFVGAKRESSPTLSARSGDEITASKQREQRGRREDYSTLSWLIGSAPFSILAGVAMFYTLTLLISVLAPYTTNPTGLRWSGMTYPVFESPALVWLLGICAAFAGSFITALRNLYRAIKNFDLSPNTVTGEAVRMLLSVILGPIFVVSTLWVGKTILAQALPLNEGLTGPSAIATVVTFCFAAGIMPEIALRALTQRDELKNFKREEEDVFRAFKITPVEIIDGIDSEIRNRLDDHHIHSTQNLAAANPLMLFVETPFGVYQIMDWVAQAQLCCSVGREKVIQLWPLGVRTLFDLERHASPGDRKDALILEVGRVILGTKLVPVDVVDRATAIALIRASIELRLDDPHVQRLRQIYIAVGDRLGSDSRRFGAKRYSFRCRYRAGKTVMCRVLTRRAA
jgi:hypothetical protein